MNLYDLAWKNDTFFGKLALFFGTLWYDLPSNNWWHIKTPEEKKLSADSCVALASTCYSIAASAFARMKSAVKKPLLLAWLIPFDLVWCIFTWLPLGAICSVCSLHFCRQADLLVRYTSLTPEQLDVCQSVLRKCGYIEQAQKCIEMALDKKPEKWHTRGLLRIARAEIFVNHITPRKTFVFESYESYIKAHVNVALICAELSEESEPAQASRIYRQCANVLMKLDKFSYPETVGLLKKAEELAEKAGAKDQLAKLP